MHSVWAAAQLAWSSCVFVAAGMLGQEVHSMLRLGLQAHRWGRLEEPAGGTWVATHRASDVGVDTLGHLHKPTGASAELVQIPLGNLVKQEAV